MNNDILIAYDTIHGSTTVIAKYIGDQLIAEGRQVSVRNVSEINHLDANSTLVLGTPIIIGQLTNPMIQFLERYRDVLYHRKCALFVVCLVTALGIRNAKEVEQRYIHPLLKSFPEIKPLSTAVFTGVLDYSLYDEQTRDVMQHIYGQAGGPTIGRHDYRNWDEIRNWCRLISDKL